MNLLEFVKEFPDEASCRKKFKEYREQIGVVCPKCGGKDHYWKSDKGEYECKKCKKRQSLRSGTVMHSSKLPFRYWFIAIHLLSSTRKGFSALEIQRQLGHKFYEPIWAMVHKLRSVMGDRDSLYQLKGTIELDEGFFSVPVEEKDKDKPLKRGRGSQQKAKVLVMAESQPVEDKNGDKGKQKGKKNRKVGYLKMQVIDDLKAQTVQGVVSGEVDLASEIDSDDSTSYKGLEKMVAAHRPKVIPKTEIGKTLPWVHIAISNAKRLFLDIYHNINGKYLQNYLNEFCYKFNRRYFGQNLFDRILIAAVSYKNHFRYNS